MTRFPDLFAALAAPFEAEEVRFRAQGGRQFAYITARTAMNRLDSILGPENWWDDYVPAEHSVLCRLTIRIADPDAAEGGGWLTLTKSDAGGYAGMADSGDDEKSGFSDAFKRAAVKFGVGRYLYRDGVPAFVREREPAGPPPPAIAPPSTLPSVPREPAPFREGEGEGNGNGNGNGNGPGKGAPRTGRALFAWLKDQEQRHEIVILNYLTSWAKLQGFPGRMVDWDADQVALGYHEATRKSRAVPS